MSKPAKFPWVSAYLAVLDVDKAVDFYKNAFGFSVQDVAAGKDGVSMHAEMTYKDQVLMMGQVAAYNGTVKTPKESNVECPINLYVYTDNVDAFYTHAIATGAKSCSEPENTFWHDRMCRLSDIDGYIWSFATHVGE